MRDFIFASLAIACVVALSNFAVQYPVTFVWGSVNFADLLTWGAFTYPLAFLVIDLVNRKVGPTSARRVVGVGFIVGVVLSIILASPRLALASGVAFLVSQLLDISLFHRLRQMVWWCPPLISSLVASAIDTVLFFSLAFSVTFNFIGADDVEFAQSTAPFLTLFFDASIWMSWAVADFFVKILVAALALLPYRLLLGWFSLMPARTA